MLGDDLGETLSDDAIIADLRAPSGSLHGAMATLEQANVRLATAYVHFAIHLCVTEIKKLTDRQEASRGKGDAE